MSTYQYVVRDTLRRALKFEADRTAWPVKNNNEGTWFATIDEARRFAIWAELKPSQFFVDGRRFMW